MTDKQKSCAQDRTIKEIFFRTDGRLNRWRYFTRRVIVSIVTKIFLFIGYKILGYEYEQVTTAATVYNSAVSIIFLLPIYCLTVRRLQDMNQNKMLAVVYVILNVITAVAFSDITFAEFKQMDTMSPYIVLSFATFSMMLDLYFMISPGTYGKNKFGSNPLDEKKVILKKQTES